MEFSAHANKTCVSVRACLVLKVQLSHVQRALFHVTEVALVVPVTGLKGMSDAFMRESSSRETDPV